MEIFRLSVLLALAISLSVEGGNRRHFRSIKAPKETIFNYEIVTPRIVFKDSNQTHLKVSHIIIPTHESNYSLVLELNEVILSSGFTSRHYNEQGEEVVTKGHMNCFYQGWVEDHPNWTATMSTCHGLQGSFGDVNDENNFYHVEPLSTEDKAMEQLHAFYLDSEYKDKQGSCGSNHSHVLNDQIHWPNLDEIQESKPHRLRRQSAATLYVEWIAVNDHAQYIENGGSLSGTVLRALTLANEMDVLFRPLNIRVILIESITWNNGDLINISSNPDTLLTTFRDQQGNLISTPYDSAMLITGIDLDGSTAGIAFVGTMCSPTSSVGVTQDGGRSLSSTASIAAHELGHIFNMGHDDNTRNPMCVCADGNQGCIMAASSGFPPPTKWSSCSISDLNSGFSMLSTDRCLFNVPTTTVGDPVCGNGIREGDEVCDCGSARECTDPCCNATTCQLASGAQCSAGSCCTSSCQFVSYGTQCRAATGDCDIAEYCPGDSGECPADKHQRDGTSCNSDVGYCNSGMCPTHNTQCQAAFGSDKGADLCYSILNNRGDPFGNCGHTTTAFTPCSVDDVQCGQLQCMSGELVLENLPAVTVTVSTVNIGQEVCRSFTTQPDVNMDIESPGLVEDGTRCGDGRICLSQQCVDVSQITTLQCDTAPNGQICSGNGVCNNHRSCSCNVGFTGINCETQFSGPGEFAIQFNQDTPAVTRNWLDVSFSTTTPIRSATCRVTTQPTVDCTQGLASFELPRRIRRRLYTLRIRAISMDDEVRIVRRRFASETRKQCGVHLINEGVVVANGVVTIMVQVTGPSRANRLDAQFECRVDSSDSFSPCGGSPIQLAADPGDHRVDIRPLDPDGVCRRTHTLNNVCYSVPQS